MTLQACFPKISFLSESVLKMESPIDGNEADMSTVSAQVAGTLHWASFCGINLSELEQFFLL